MPDDPVEVMRQAFAEPDAPADKNDPVGVFKKAFAPTLDPSTPLPPPNRFDLGATFTDFVKQVPHGALQVADTVNGLGRAAFDAPVHALYPDPQKFAQARHALSTIGGGYNAFYPPDTEPLADVYQGLVGKPNNKLAGLAGDFAGQALIPGGAAGMGAKTVKGALMAGAGTGALTGAATSIGDQYSHGGKIDWGQVAQDAAINAGISSGFAGAGRGIANRWAQHQADKFGIPRNPADIKPPIAKSLSEEPPPDNLFHQYGPSAHSNDVPPGLFNATTPPPPEPPKPGPFLGFADQHAPVLPPNARVIHGRAKVSVPVPSYESPQPSDQVPPREKRGKLKAEPPAMKPPKGKPEAGQARFLADAKGRNVVRLPGDMEDNHPLKGPLTELATMKAAWDRHVHRYEEYVKDLWSSLEKAKIVDKSRQEYPLPNGMLLTRHPEPPRLKDEARLELEAKRNELVHPEDVPPTTDARHVRVTMGEHYGPTGDPHAVQSDYEPVPSTLGEASEKLKELKRLAEGESLKREDPLAKFDEKRKELAKLIKPYHDALLKKDPLAPYHVNVPAETPHGQPVNVRVTVAYNPTIVKLREKEQDIHDALKRELMAQDFNLKHEIKYAASLKGSAERKAAMSAEDITNLARKALSVVAAIDASSGAAQASDGLPGTNDGKNWAAARAAVELAAIAALNVKAFKFIINNRFVQSHVWISDTLDHLKAIDHLTGSNLYGRITMSMGEALKAGFGVKWDHEEEAKALLGAVRRGEISAEQLANRAANTRFQQLGQKLSDQELLALQHMQAIRDHTLKAVSKGLKAAQAALADRKMSVNAGAANAVNPGHPLQQQALQALPKSLQNRWIDHETRALESSVNALRDLHSSLAGTPGTAAAQIYQKCMNRIYDYFFWRNPAFQGVNFFDRFVAGLPEVGPESFAWASNALSPFTGGIRSIKQLFAHTNFTGGMHAAREMLWDATAPLKEPPKEWVDSDAANAKLIGAAAQHQYGKLAFMRGEYKRSAEQFVKDLHSGKLPFEQQIAAWQHTAVALSRTLAVDPLKINTNLLGHSDMGRALAGFANQPFRIARQALYAVAENNPAKLYWFLGATALAGGSAMIPQEERMAWKALDADAYFTAAKGLDNLQCLHFLFGNDMAPKLGWGLFAPLQGASNAVGEQAGGALKDFVEGMEAIGKNGTNLKAYDWPAGMRNMSKLASLVMPRIGSIPTKLALAGYNAFDEAFIKGGYKKSFFDDLDRSLGKAVNVRLSQFGIAPVKHFLQKTVIPGREWTDLQLQHQRENVRATKHGNAHSQHFSNQDAHDQSLLNRLLGGG